MMDVLRNANYVLAAILNNGLKANPFTPAQCPCSPSVDLCSQKSNKPVASTYGIKTSPTELHSQ